MTAILFLLPIFLSKPLRQLTETADSFAKGRYDSADKPTPYLEFQPLFSTLKEMGQKIDIQVSELRRLEENFRNSLDNSPLGIRIVNAEGELHYANQAMLDIYGYSSVEELRTTPSKERYTPQSYAEHRERVQMRKLGKPVPSNYEISIVRKDGKIRYLVVFRREVEWNGETQFQVLYEDITERKQAEQVIQEREIRFRELADLLPQTVFELDLRGNLSIDLTPELAHR